MIIPLHLCSNCGAKLAPLQKCQDRYDDLACYTLALGGVHFIHQHVVDAYAAQHVRPDSKPISLAAALIGLYLFAEHDYTGREVQRVHMLLGNKMKKWPLFPAPRGHAAATVVDVLETPAGPERERAIRIWAKAVWETWQERHAEVEKLLRGQYNFEIRPPKPRA